MRHFTGQRWFIRSQGGIPMSDSMSLVGAKYYPKTGKKRLNTTVSPPYTFYGPQFQNVKGYGDSLVLVKEILQQSQA